MTLTSAIILSILVAQIYDSSVARTAMASLLLYSWCHMMIDSIFNCINNYISLLIAQ
jgi:hypothetical protein